MLPERKLSGQWLEVCKRVPGVEIEGIYLRLPGMAERMNISVRWNPEGS